MRVDPSQICLATCLALWIVLPVAVEAKPKKGKSVEAAAAEEGKKKEKKGPRPYAEVITEEMTADPGLFTVHRDGDDVYFEIPVTRLGKEMIWVSQIAETQAGYMWAGMPLGDRVVRWERRGDRVLLRDVKYDIRADGEDWITRAVEANSVAPIIHVFDVEAYGQDHAPVINVTPLLISDTREFSAKESLAAESLDEKRTIVDQVKSFPTNIEMKVLATYKLKEKKDDGKDDRGPGFPSSVPRDPTQSGVTVLLHHSMVELPERPMSPRIWDDRVGFFSVRFDDYGDDSDHEVKKLRYITRWRLEKKNPDQEVSDPVEPIVWYVGREVPEKMRQACIDGINAWQPAFEKAGFSNAIIGKLAPTEEEDSDWDPEDARYTTIRWLPSAVENAFGPHVHDPRTGEILEADVRMFHNVLKLVRDWYFVQASPNDPRAQKLPMPDDLMAELVQFVVTHEVGHSLGFPHNMKASSAYSVDQLRDPEFTAKMGTAPSIMDYARFNYVAQPGDGAALLPRVGVYDDFAVEWGYREFPEGADEKAELEKIVARQKEDPMLRFGNRRPLEDPTRQTEDLSVDAVEATRLGLANLERVASYLVEATSRPGDDYRLLENMHKELLGQWRREMVHVANLAGGVEQINLFYGDADQRFFPVSGTRQREAVAFLNEHALATPEFLLDPDVTRRLEAAGVADRVLAVQRAVLAALHNEDRIKRMAELVELDPDNAYPAVEMMTDVTAAIWSELDHANPQIDFYRRNLQRTQVEGLSGALESDDVATDLPALARGQLRSIRDRCKRAASKTTDATTTAHLVDIIGRIDAALEKVSIASTHGAKERG